MPSRDGITNWLVFPSVDYSKCTGCMECSASICKQEALSHPALQELKIMMEKAGNIYCKSSGGNKCCG